LSVCKENATFESFSSARNVKMLGQMFVAIDSCPC